jgi:hypothetical protein
MTKAVFVNGVRWAPFQVTFQTQEGTFTCELFAVDHVHAIERLEELKATAVVTGEIVGRHPA